MLLSLPLVLALAAGPVMTGSPFDGVWTKDLASVKGFAKRPETVSFALVGNTFRMRLPTGEHYEAVIGGPAATVEGGSEPHTVVVRRLGPMTLRMDEKDGDDAWSCTLTAEPARKAVKVLVETDGGKTTSTFDWVKR